MNGRAGPLSPISPEGSEWSGISRYQSIDNTSPYSPAVPPNRGLATPPISSGSTSGTMNGGMPNGVGRSPNDSPGNPSPPSSIARSSMGVGMYPPSESGSRKGNLMLEELLLEHYIALKRYLAKSLREEQNNPRPNRARDKLLRLSTVQFQELSTDVFDELLRRQAGQRSQGAQSPGPPPYLLPKDNFHPKRNQARQKLSTLPPPRFRDLATDVYYELERRYPRFMGNDIERMGSPAGSVRSMAFGGPPGPRPGSRGMGGPRGPGGPGFQHPPRQGSLAIPGGSPGNEYGRPLPKTFQQNTIVPNKSTMVEDDDDQTGPDDDDDGDAFGLEGAARQRQSKRNTTRTDGEAERDKKMIAELQEKLDDLTVQVRQKDQKLGDMDGIKADKQAWSNLREDLEGKLAEAQHLNDSLQSELDKVRANYSNMERDMRNQVEQARRQGGGGSEWQGRYQNLQQEHEALKVELSEQQHVTEEVKREASEFLREMKTISDRSDHISQKEEEMVGQVHRLENEVKEWKGRYTRAKTQLRHLRASSIGLSLEGQGAGHLTRNNSFTRPDGLVRDVHVTRFQIAIDELLRAARSNEPAAALDHIKSVVVSVRQITQDLGDGTTENGDEAHRRNKMKTRVSATANNLITAAKNFSISRGLSPISLLDAAASHLTAAVVDLIRVVKIRPTPEDELDDDENDPIPSNEGQMYFPVRKGVASQISQGSVYSSLSSQRASYGRPGSKERWSTRQSVSRGGPNGKSAPTNLKMGFGPREHDNEIEELKIYLEDQTEHLVHSIQALVGSIRGADGMPTIRAHIDDIASVVGKVVTSTETAINNTGSSSLRDRGEPITRKLAECQVKLMNASAEGENIRDAATMKDFSNRLPPLAFEIARETKELVQRVDQIEHSGLEEESESFR